LDGLPKSSGFGGKDGGVPGSDRDQTLVVGEINVLVQGDGNLPQRKLCSLIFGASALLQCEDMDSMDMMGQQQ